MGSSYLPPPEQNVVNVGDEISAAALAGIQAASPSLSQANPAATEDYVASAIAAIPAPPPNITDYDNFKVYAAGEIVLTSNDFYRFNTFIGAAGYGPITHPSAWTKLSSQDLAGYALLSGATFTGKANFTPVSGDAGLNVGIGGTSTASTTNGDLWIATGGVSLNYRDGNGAWRIVAITNSLNTFSSPQVINTTSTTTALRVTQTGTGDAIRVEDDTTPDVTRFAVDQFGKVGIGIAPDASAALKVDGNGIMFGNGTTQTSAAPMMDQITEFIFSGSVVRSSVSTAIYAGIYDTVIVGYDGTNDMYDTVGGSFAVGTITASNLRFNGNSFSTDSATTNYIASGELLGSGSYYNSYSLVNYWWAAYSDGNGSGYIYKDLTSDPSIP